MPHESGLPAQQAGSEARIVLMCGLPGSGKTTTAKRLARDLPAVRLCTDEWQADLGIEWSDEGFHDRLEARLWELGKQLLRLGQTVVFEKGLWRRAERDEKRREATELGLDIELHYFDVPVPELARRLAARAEKGGPDAFPVLEAQLIEYARSFQKLDADEWLLFSKVVVHS